MPPDPATKCFPADKAVAEPADLHCPLCDRPLTKRIHRGELAVELSPPRIYWQGRALKGAPRVKVQILAMLMRFGRVEMLALLMLLGEGAGPSALTAHIAQLRRMLRENGVTASIENIHGWGYKLVTKGLN